MRKHEASNLMSSEWQKVEQNEGSYNPNWDFSQNKEVIGLYDSKRENVGNFKSNVYTLEQEDGKKVDVWGCTTLDQAMEGIKTGMLVKIVYTGLKDIGRGNPLKLFEVYQKDPAVD